MRNIVGGDSFVDNDDFVRLDENKGRNDHLKERVVRERTPLRRCIVELMRDDVPWLNQDEAVVKHLYNKSPIMQLNHEIKLFSLFMSPTQKEMETRDRLFAEITDTIKQVFEDLDVVRFGSSCTGLYLPTSDMDVVCIGKLYDIKSSMKKIANVLGRTLSNPRDIEVLSNARIPIIKFVDKRTKYTVDISFNSGDPAKDGDVVSGYMQKFKAIKPLVHVIKHFLRIRGLNEVYHGGLGSYSLTLMVINFIQLHPMVQMGLVDPCDNLGVLLIEFFELYGNNFHYREVGISVKNKYYYSKREHEKINGHGNSLLSIEYPNDRRQNVSQNSYCMPMVRKSFKYAYKALSTVLTYMDKERKGEVEARKQYKSILSIIVHVNKGMLKHRNFIEELI